MNNYPPRKWIAVFITLLAVMIIVPNSSYSADARYALAETVDGTLRLDKRSGAISYCRRVSGGIACSMAADEREAWVKATEGMADRIDQLEKRLAHLEALNEITPQQETQSKPNAQVSKQNPGRFDTAVNASKGFLRRMIGALKEMNFGFGKG